jgi:hypothetical protein
MRQLLDEGLDRHRVGQVGRIVPAQSRDPIRREMRGGIRAMP